MNNSPEINLAKRISDKHGLSVPIDVFELATQYANVKSIRFPVNLDGICLNLKVSGKTPTIIVNSDKSSKRQRFTLAHEIGHVLIPWHTGTIVDEIDISEKFENGSYWEMESEANRFAAELLMPKSWTRAIIEKCQNPCEMLQIISDSADVSVPAALIQLLGALEAGYLWVCLDDSRIVKSSGRSDGTLAGRPRRGSHLDPASAFPASDHRWQAVIRDDLWVWWHFPWHKALPAPDSREWRDILDEILTELNVDEQDSIDVKKVISGVFGHANSMSKRNSNSSKAKDRQEILYAASLQRFENRARDHDILRAVVDHRDFRAFLASRITALMDK